MVARQVVRVLSKSTGLALRRDGGTWHQLTCGEASPEEEIKSRSGLLLREW